MATFILPRAVWCVVNYKLNLEPLTITLLPQEEKALCLFTEELHAERAAEAKWEGIVPTHLTEPKSIVRFLKWAVMNDCSHVAIDPLHPTGCPALPILEFANAFRR